MLLLWKRSSPGPGTGNVDIPIGILMILGCASLQKSTFPHKTWNFIKFQNFQEVPWISWFSWFSQKILTLQWRTPQNHQYSLRNINVFAWAAREAPVSRKTENFRKFRKITENLENSGKCRNSVKTRKAETAAGPPSGPPTRPRWGPPVIIRQSVNRLPFN